MIIDTHQHLGRSQFTGVETTRDELLSAMDEHGVDVALVMPQPTREDLHEYHDRIAKDVASAGGRLFGMASIDPWWSEADYLAEAARCVSELGFRALKLHPLAHNIGSDHGEADKVFRAAQQLTVPVIVHTGLGTPWALPALCIAPARKYPDVTVILAHAGWGVYSNEALIAAEVCPNVILEPSWCPSYVVRKIADAVGAERMLFGSDHITNLPVELTKLRSVGLSEGQLDTILSQNPRRIFQLPL